MTQEHLLLRFTELCREDLPSPGSGASAIRHRRIFEAGREDLSLAKLAEAHWDAVAILRESGRRPLPDARYAVWASEVPGRELQLSETADGLTVSGTKEFCSGAGLVDCALITAGVGGSNLVEIDLRSCPDRLVVDNSGWVVDAFRMTNTSAITFDSYPVHGVVGRENWYVQRPGFWQGACGPAAAWAGGAAGLLDFVMNSKRDDPHTAAHRAAMHANVWATQCFLDIAAKEFDADSKGSAMVRALEVRHLVEQACTDTLRRFARCMGPGPLAKNADTARRYAELDIFLRQSHGERDLEGLGRVLQAGE
ncbi:MAG: acyl-CoA dehydrogenase [Janthinobacterium lividum]